MLWFELCLISNVGMYLYLLRAGPTFSQVLLIVVSLKLLLFMISAAWRPKIAPLNGRVLGRPTATRSHLGMTSRLFMHGGMGRGALSWSLARGST